MTPIYLDHNASSPLLPEAWEAMRRASEVVGNPASGHRAGRAARRLLEDSREEVASLLGAVADEVVFTSGATEANNLAVFGMLSGRPEADAPAHALAARIEHPCVVGPLTELSRRGVAVDWLPITPTGTVEVREVAARLRPDTRLVALMLANHETGAVQPVAEVAKLAPVHCDAAQAVGKMPVHFGRLGVATLTASGHKFGGPPGVGVLLVRRGVRLEPRAFGGPQQRGLRPGTEPVALAVGFAAALRTAVAKLDETRATLRTLRDRFLGQLREAVPGLVVNGDPAGLPGTVNVSFPGWRADLLVTALDLAGVACSTGAACASGSAVPSDGLRAMGLPDDVVRGAVRFSLAPSLTSADIDVAVRRVTACVKT